MLQLVPVFNEPGLKGKPAKIRRYPRSCKLQLFCLYFTPLWPHESAAGRQQAGSEARRPASLNSFIQASGARRRMQMFEGAVYIFI
jgi:hypothetical protein